MGHDAAVDLLAELQEGRGLGHLYASASPDGDRLEVLRPHHRPHPGAGGGPVEVADDAGDLHQVLPRRGEGPHQRPRTEDQDVLGTQGVDVCFHFIVEQPGVDPPAAEIALPQFPAQGLPLDLPAGQVHPQDRSGPSVHGSSLSDKAPLRGGCWVRSGDIPGSLRAH